MATIHDVAREAEVSTATVSRVLNGDSRVRPQTAQRVLAAVEKFSYEPNLTARNLRRNESRVALILTPNLTNPYYSHILTGIVGAAREHHFNTMVCSTDNDLASVLDYLSFLDRRRADGAILISCDPINDEILSYAKKYPFVQCSEFDDKNGLPHIGVDNYAAAVDTVEYLISLGHTRLGVLSCTNSFPSTRERMRGFCDTVLRHGLELNSGNIGYGSPNYSFESGFSEATKILSSSHRPTALFCISDVLALGAISAARSLGLRVPQDITITGFDDVEYANLFSPLVTTLAQPCIRIGEESMDLLYRLIKKLPCERRLTLEHELRVRETSAPPHD